MPGDKLTILFLAANPVDTDQLRLDEEMRAIDKALREAAFRDRFDLRSAWAVRYGDLQELLLRHAPHIVHFSGHGSELGEIALKDASGKAQLVPPEALAALFAILKDNIRCVVLNACYSEKQARGIAKSIDCVVGMKRVVTDDAALDFAAGFYLGIGYGRSVKTAFDMGSNRIGLGGGDEMKTPKLLAPRGDPATMVLVGDTGTKPNARAESGVGSGDTITTIVGAGAQNIAAGKGVVQQIVPPLVTSGAKPLPTALRPEQYAEFQAALLSAFDLDTLRQTLRLQMNANLDAVAGGANLSAVAFNVIDWALRSGRLPELIEAALAAQPGNPALRAFVGSLK